MAVFSIQLTRNPYQTGEPRGLSPSGGNSAANLLSLVCPAPYGRGVGSWGTAPCASLEACCRAAVTLQPTCFLTSIPAPIGRGMGSRGTAPCASHEACRRMAVFTMQITWSHTRSASRGTRRATAVKPQPTHMSPYAPARPRRAVMGAGL